MSENKREFDIKDTYELGQILDTVGDKVPKLIKDIMGSLYSKENAANMGQAVGTYYKELIAAGIPQEDALDMAKSMAFSLKDIQFNSGK